MKDQWFKAKNSNGSFTIFHVKNTVLNWSMVEIWNRGSEVFITIFIREHFKESSKQYKKIKDFSELARLFLLL